MTTTEYPQQSTAVDISLPKGAKWDGVLRGGALAQLEASLPDYLRSCRWFGAKAREVTGATIMDLIPIPYAGETSYVTLVRVSYSEGDPDTYVLPLAFATGEAARQIEGISTNLVIARLTLGDTVGVVYDATRGRSFPSALLDAMIRRKGFQGDSGQITSESGPALRGIRSARTAQLEPAVSRAEQSNTSIVYGGRFVLKLLRRLQDGVNPDLEVARFLTDRASFPNVPPLAGALEYCRERGAPSTLAVLQGYIRNEGDAWSYTLGALRDYWQRVAGKDSSTLDRTLLSLPPFSQAQDATNDAVEELFGSYLHSARLLGRRTGELHLALASDGGDPAFQTETFTLLQQRSLYQTVRRQISSAFLLLQNRVGDLPEDIQKSAVSLLERRETGLLRIRPVLEHRLGGKRIRTHGDFHLGQVLFTGDDFVLIDFEGEPARSLEERRAKRSPLRDVAGMLRSFDYAVHSSLSQWAVEAGEEASTSEASEPWGAFWRACVSAAYLKTYLDAVANSGLLPEDPDDVSLLLEVFLWEKAAYELSYELNNRPSWSGIPIRGLLYLLGA